jgi:RING finger family protein
MFTLIPSPTCPRCQRPVLDDAEQVVCDACLATHHERCWHQGAGCSALNPEASAPPAPAERPIEVRVRPKSFEPMTVGSEGSEGTVGSERRRKLVHSLGHREGNKAEDFEATRRARPVFQPPRVRPEVGEERPCRKCNTPFTVTNPLERRCKRCVNATYWKIGIVFAVIVIWKVLF